jgi:hypothetical protein
MDAFCPMMAGASAHAMEHTSTHDTAGMAEEVDCHDHDGDAAKTGKSCPSGTTCHAAGTALLYQCLVPVIVSVAYPAPPPAWLNFQSHDPPLLLRPPARI